MSTNLDSAKQFFEACETGEGWEGCNAFCHPEATFSSQTTVLSDVTTLEGYCEWMKNLLTPSSPWALRDSSSLPLMTPEIR